MFWVCSDCSERRRTGQPYRKKREGGREGGREGRRKVGEGE